MGFIDTIKERAKADKKKQSFFRRQRTEERMKPLRKF